MGHLSTMTTRLLAILLAVGLCLQVRGPVFADKPRSVPSLCLDEGILPNGGSPPSVLRNVDLEESIAAMQGLIDSGCSDVLGRFLCTAHLPRLSPIIEGLQHRDVYLGPCAEICRGIWRACRSKARQLNIGRTPEFDCSKNYVSMTKDECLSYLLPPRNPPWIVNATRHSPELVSILHASPIGQPPTQAFRIRYNETLSPQSQREIIHALDPTSQANHVINVTNLETSGNYTFEITSLNDFGEGPTSRVRVAELVKRRPVDAPNKDHCQNITVPLCSSGIDYTQTSLPGPLNYQSQDDAGLSIHQFYPLVKVECSPYLRAFLCSMYVPRCEASNRGPLPSCRDLCIHARNGCRELMNKFGFSWPNALMCERLPSYSDGGGCYLGGAPLLGSATSDRCEAITVSTCHPSIIGYNKTAMPNLMGHKNQQDAGLQISTFEPLIQSDCSPYLRTFLCAMYTPRCDASSPSVSSPCRELCVKVRDGCQSLLREFGFDWPEGLMCESLPSQEDGSTCDFVDRPVDVPNKDHCQNITVPMCRSGMDYAQTSLPGPLGHHTQDEAGLEIHQYYPLVEIECSPYIKAFLCSIYFPRCETSRTPLPPCRDLCVQARNGCGKLLNQYGFSWPNAFMCERLPSYSDGGGCYLGGAPLLGPATSDRCEDITVSTCHPSIIGYNKTAMPNLMGHENQRDAGLQISTFEPLLLSDCSPYFRTFFCAMYIPRCDVSSSSVSPPCRELCVKVRDGCQSLLSDFGFDWQEGFRCENLPSQNDSSTCYSLETRTFNQTDVAGNQSNQTWPGTEFNTTRVVKPRRYDIHTLGVPSLFRGWVDVQGQGAANDYCRVIINSSGGYFLSCALAGMQGHNSEFNYNSTGMWFDAGHMDTWYMLDVNKDGRDDYCRCVGCVPDTHVSCLLSGKDGFTEQTLEYDPVPGGCHYNPVNPFFGRS